ncbi:C-type lectin domain family 2 member D [Chelonia mydas]|uniref:C-type lectin domain family 2 member D n=1 Tax=Chelonia mydas TaxID=8469 RepID=M7C9I1_CHEMY|nr:C-type lectin domain family 2 member D [Chelonia mydas]
MPEGAEANPSGQPLNSSMKMEDVGEPDVPAKGNLKKAAVSEGRAVFIAIVVVLVVIIITALAAALGGNWTYSRSFCSSHAASLAGIDNLQKLDSLLPYKGKLDHWIGLWKDAGQVWKWANGTEFDHRFEIQGGADCAYLDEDLTVSSSSCSSLRKWICSKPV